jgi:hypothetical protein
MSIALSTLQGQLTSSISETFGPTASRAALVCGTSISCSFTAR